MKIKNKKWTITFMALIVTNFALAQSNSVKAKKSKVDRSLSAACAFDIKQLSILSGDDTKDMAAVVEPEINEFSEGIPTVVTVKIQYEVQNCIEPLTAELVLVPLVGSNKVNTESSDLFVASSAAAKAAAVWQVEKPWLKINPKVSKLKKSGEISLRKVPVLKYYEALAKDKHAWALRFEVRILEGERDVAQKEVTIDVDMRI
jgi:hypothetical protein